MVQEEVKRLRDAPTVLENSGVGDSPTNGAVAKAVQALGEQVRLIKAGLESRLGIRLTGSHAVTPWILQHAADLLSKCIVGDSSRAPCKRREGKTVTLGT